MRGGADTNGRIESTQLFKKTQLANSQSERNAINIAQNCLNNSRPPSTPVGMVVTRESEFSYSFGTPIPLLKARLVSSA